MGKEKCFITGKEFEKKDLVHADTIRRNLLDFIKKDYPKITSEVLISQEALKIYRQKYLESIIIDESGDLDKMEQEVIQAIAGQELVSENLAKGDSKNPNFGQRLADRVATFGGSWTFIIFFFTLLLLWILLNSIILATKAFDPYPYILMNLILSCIAALQAPVIMMSQNRQETKDRQRSEYDYKVNLKAELEIRMLHEKIDHLMMHQTQKLLELQQMQMDLLEDMADKKDRDNLSKHEN
ncbi:DUF1003 domain-containing protein [Arcticibacter eurypsychrophilus]|uniref:DUF1003 domain-containing protein n=1 Tax=Arcticibacter eurypsychrophilus TaxID=1434752 RepID=UPI00084D34AA|nr:DUF1003 domain-containing protein [Arcticibacter eurypsychrophilus]